MCNKMFENNITVKMDIRINGEMYGMNTRLRKHFHKWNNLKSDYNIDKTWENVNKAINRLDKFDCIDIVLTDGNYYNPRIFQAIRFTEQFRHLDEITVLKIDSNNNTTDEYEEIKKVNYRKFKSLLKKNLFEYFSIMNNIHLNKMHELLNEIA